MTIIYVAHPLRPLDHDVAIRTGIPDRIMSWAEALRVETRANLDRALRWMAWLRRAFPRVTFIAPWIEHALSGDDDTDPAQREKGLHDDCAVVERCDGLVLVGGRVSSGMQRESGSAQAVYDLTPLGNEPPAVLTAVDLAGWVPEEWQ